MMYPMVQRDQQQPQEPEPRQSQSQPRHQQEAAACLQHQHQQQQKNQQQQQDDPESQEDPDAPKTRVKRPLFRRVYNYVREAWTGVKSALDSELEDLETPPRYRPDSLESLCRATRFTQAEIKRIYRGFKAECPTGVVKEETFKMIYAQFFPQG
ncbi:PREDICTED: transcription factor TBF1-like, partial [Nicrophorus vespilloides]|uniref:Transcription factor TBF1-like n=1 Tax=Nicrophorus vespilloides TaxID=110193 RepID=A0ABM1MZS3_NICVS